MSEERRLREQRNEVLERARDMLIEHFDSVQIVATSRNENGDTALHAYGSGNHYARAGSVAEWLAMTEESGPVDQERD